MAQTSMSWVVAVLEGVGYRLEGEDCDTTEDFGARLVVVGRLRSTQRPKPVLSRGGRSTCVSTSAGEN